MKVRCATLWVAAAVFSMLAAIAPAPSPAAESKAIEVTPDTDTVAEDSADTETAAEQPAETVAREVLSAGNLSWRQVGSTPPAAPEPPATAGPGSYVAPPTGWPQPTGSLDELRHDISVMDSGTIYLGEYSYASDMVNDVYATAYPGQSLRATMGYSPFGTPTRVDPRAERWQVSGSIGAGLGSATYGDNDAFEFSLRESLTTLSDKHYEFYQKYDIDHTYVDSTTLTIGARQRFNNWAANGDLRLTEEFQLYQNDNNPDYDRQEGLFALRFDPQWLNGRVAALIDYKYRIRLYEDFSTLSYKHNALRTKLQYDFSPTVSTVGLFRLDDYNYSQGSTRDNQRNSVGNEWTWQALPNVRLAAGVTREDKTYDNNPALDYEKQEYDARLQWEPDSDSQLELRGELTDYQRVNNAAADYSDNRVSARYRRDLTTKLDIDLQGSVRSKEYDSSPLSDLDVNAASIRLNLNPDYHWNLYAGYGLTEYDYASPGRRFSRNNANAGVSYGRGPLRAVLGYRRDNNSYDYNTAFDYTRNNYDFSLDYRLNANRWRVYYGLGVLDQVMVNSFNDYTETRLGIGWDVDLDADTKLRLSYDFNEREYDQFNSIDYSQLGAKLEFDL